MFFQLLSDRNPEVLEAFDSTSKTSLDEVVGYQDAERKINTKSKLGLLEQKKIEADLLNRLDASVKFSILENPSDMGDGVDRFDLTLSQALGAATSMKNSADAFATSKLNKVNLAFKSLKY